MLENVNELLIYRCYVGIWALVVGRIVYKRRRTLMRGTEKIIDSQ